MKYTPMRLHPADIKHRHQQQASSAPIIQYRTWNVSLQQSASYPGQWPHRLQSQPTPRQPSTIISTAPIPTSSTQPTSISAPIHITSSISSSISSISSTSSISSRYHIHHNSHHCIDRSLPQYIKSSASDVTASIAISQSAIQPVGQPDSHSYRRTDQQSARHSFTQTD